MTHDGQTTRHIHDVDHKNLGYNHAKLAGNTVRAQRCTSPAGEGGGGGGEGQGSCVKEMSVPIREDTKQDREDGGGGCLRGGGGLGHRRVQHR